MPRKYEKSKNLIGRRYYKLTIISQTFKDMKYYLGDPYMVKCVCDCGKEVVVRLSNLKQGRIKSCGCYKKEYMSNKMRQRGKVFDSDARDKLSDLYRYFINKSVNGMPDFTTFIEDMKDLVPALLK